MSKRDAYWRDLVESRGVREGLIVVLDRLAFFKANTKEPLGEGWAHLDVTADLVVECLNASPRPGRMRVGR